MEGAIWYMLAPLREAYTRSMRAPLVQTPIWAFLALGNFIPMWAAETSLYYLSWGATQQTCCMITDGRGNVYIAGRVSETDPLYPGFVLSTWP